VALLRSKPEHLVRMNTQFGRQKARRVAMMALMRSKAEHMEKMNTQFSKEKALVLWHLQLRQLKTVMVIASPGARVSRSMMSPILVYANNANISTVEISSNTMARLTPRDSNTTFVPNSVSDLHPMAGILIVTGIWPNTRLGYPTTDNSFTSTDGVVCGTFDDAGDIFDPELNFLGNIVAERYE
jgi:hypothetical protein